MIQFYSKQGIVNYAIAAKKPLYDLLILLLSSDLNWKMTGIMNYNDKKNGYDKKMKFNSWIKFGENAGWNLHSLEKADNSYS